jgi:hypothetical protein
VTLLTIQDIADQLGIDYRAAQKRLWRAGIEPTKIIGRTNLYPHSVLRWFEPRPSAVRPRASRVRAK